MFFHRLRSLCLLAIVWINVIQAHAAMRFGLPGIRNYSRSEYQGGTQNWAAAQAANGMLYFANNSGLLEFDGAKWHLYTSIKPINRALCVDNNRIYVGGYNEFGYYEADSKGNLIYRSLIPLLEHKITETDDIWRIHKTSFGIVFQSFNGIFIYDGKNKIEIVSPRSKFHFSYYVNGLLWVYDEKFGLMQYREGKVRQIPGGDHFIGTQIWTILPLNDDQVIIGTAKNGMFAYDGEKISPWNTPVNDLLIKYQIFSGAFIDRKFFAFGTIQNGLLVTDTAGNIVFHLNKEKGLLNNTVLSISSDNQANIWLGLDNGISVINFNSPLTYIQNYFDIGSGYTSARSGENLYLGTNQGLFYIPWSRFLDPLKTKEDFRMVEGTEGQVWSLFQSGNTLFCGHNTGVFSINGDKAVRISNVAGAWNFLKVRQDESLLLVGNYSGISVLKNENGRWIYRNELQGYIESSHYLEQDEQGSIWVSHGYKGVFRLKVDPGLNRVTEVRYYSSKEGLPSDMGNTLFRIKNDLVVCTLDGIYQFDSKSDRFEPYKPLKSLFPGYKNIDYLNQDSYNNIWYFNNQQPGVLRYQEDGSYKNITTPFSELSHRLIPSYGHVNALDANNVIIGMEGGFAHYISNQYKNYNMVPVLYISSLQCNDSASGIYRFNSTYTRQDIVPKFSFAHNTVSIAFSASNLIFDKALFQYRLKGFDKDWSDWLPKNTKEYTNLPAGEYTFLLKAQTVNGSHTPELAFRFRILPPWYLTNLAWAIYALLLMIMVYFTYRFFLRSMEKSRQREKARQMDAYKQREIKMKEEALLTEKEMIRLRNEKLNLEMIHKEKELANSTMLLIQKNEILAKIRKDIGRIKEAISDDHVKNELNSMNRRIGREMDNEKQWQVFNMHVEQVHEELFKKLKARFPELTPRELSLCAYLRMNISSKEIATLMNISTRGVEISRYRIRRKLGLDRNANLTDFMLKL